MNAVARKKPRRAWIGEERCVGLRDDQPRRGVRLEDAESAVDHKQVPADTDRLGEAAHGGKNAFQAQRQTGNRHALDGGSSLRMGAMPLPAFVFIERDSLAQALRCRIH